MADNGTDERYFNNPKSGGEDELLHTRYTEVRLKKTGELIDARHLPSEIIANGDDPEAKAARTRLQEIMHALQTGKA